MYKIFSSIRIRSNSDIFGRIAIFILFASGGLSGQSSTIKSLYCVGNSCNDAGYYNNASQNYSGAGGAGGFRITFSDFETSGNPDYKIRYRIGTGTVTNLVGGSTNSASMTVDILNSQLPSISAGEKIQFFAVSDFGGGSAKQTTCQADGNGYEAVTSSSGDADYFYYDVGKPSVVGVESGTSDGNKVAGDVIAIRVTFNENIAVATGGGTPTLTLETGDTDRAVNYTGVSGAIATFNYTVAAGDLNDDLDYKSTTSLALNGGTIKDAAGNDATLTLATPGASNSISDNQGYDVDAVAPTVANVTCTASNATNGLSGANVTDCANGSYNENDVLSISVVFSEAVNVATANPQLTLAMDGDNETVNYNSGTGSTTLVFPFTVDANDNTADLDYAATNSLALNSATIRDGHGNNATLTLSAPGATKSLGANKALVIDTTVPTLHGTNASKVYSTKNPGSYKAGEEIDIFVGFTETVYTSGTPQLTLDFATDRAIDMSAGGGNAGSTALTFKYTVAGGENSSDLDYAATNSLSAGTYIRDLAGNNATLTLEAPGAGGSLGANEALIIDTVAPTLDIGNGGVDAATDDTYYIDDVADITVLFSEVVYVVGVPTLTLETGDTDAVVNYASGSGNNDETLHFSYTVAAPHTSADLDYQSTTALTGDIKDLAGNDATLTLPALTAAGSLSANAAVVVDGVRPTVTNVTSTANNGSYNHVDNGGGDNKLSITVTFDEAVFVSGTPTITLETGDADASVNYTSGSGGTTLTFNYTISAGHTSDDLEYTATDALAATGGAWIRDAMSTDANTATLTLPGMGNAGSLGLNKALIIDTTAPTVENVTSATDNGSYNHVDNGGGDNVIPVAITFSEAVTVTGTPKLTLETGGTDTDVNYSAGTGTTDLTFDYTISAGNTSDDLDYTAVGALTAGTSIRDAALNDATRTLAAPGQANSLGANKALIIDTTAPTVNSVSSTLADGLYNINQLVPIQVEFSEAVNVTGTPLLALETGDADANASYNAGTGGTTLTFNYTVVTGNESADLDYTATTALGAGTSIRDAALNDATRTLASPGQANSLGANKALVIDAELISVNSVSSTKTDGSYKEGVEIDVTVTLSEIANVNTTGGTPRITLETGDNDATVDYTSGTASNTLTFKYTVAAGHTSGDLDYQSTTAFVLNNGTITDPTTGTNAVLTLPALGGANSIAGQKNLIIDTTPPTVDFVSSNKDNGYYKAATQIPLVIDFSENVVVTGSPSINLETGEQDANVTYTSGSLNDTLIFNYTVSAGENSTDLDYTDVATINLNGGAITDIAGNDGTLTLATPGATNSLGANKNLVIDTIRPEVEFITSTAPDGTSKLGDVIPIIIDFTENIYVTDTPTLTLETGGTDAVVNYTSGSENDTLVFNYAVAAGHTSNDLDYAATSSLSGGGGVFMKDIAGNSVVTQLVAPGAANSLGANKALVIDGIVPRIDSLTTTTADGYYNAGDTIIVEVYVNENLAVTGTPKLTLETGESDALAAYTSHTTGSGRQSVFFRYVVSAGHNTADLDYTETTSLALDDGSIKDIAGNAINLTLPVPGQTGSIAFKKAVVVDTQAPTCSLKYTNLSQVQLINLAKGEDELGISAQFNEKIQSTPSFLLFWPDPSDTLNTAFTGSANNDSTWNYTIATLPTETSFTGNLKFRINANDLAGNPVSVVTDTTIFFLDTTPPAAFTTGDVIPGGSLPKLRWFNRRTDSLKVEFTIQNSDLTLTRGKAQTKMKVENVGGSEVAVGSPDTLTNTSLPLQSISLTKAQVRGAIGNNFNQEARIITWIDLYDKANNLTSGAMSFDTLTVDTIAPVKGTFQSGNVIAGDTLISSDVITATVTGFTDAHSGMGSYEWAVGKYREARYTELDSIKEWTASADENISGTAPLRDSTFHRLTVRGLDNAGNLSDTLGTDPGFLRLNSAPIIVAGDTIEVKEEVELSYFIQATDSDISTALTDTLRYYFFDSATQTTSDSIFPRTGSPALKIDRFSGEITWTTPYHGSTTDYTIPVKVMDNTNRSTVSNFFLKVKLNERPRYNQIAYIKVTGDSVATPVPPKVEDLWENDTLIVTFTLDDLDDDTLTYKVTADSSKLKVISADSIITSTADTIKVTFIPSPFWTKSSIVNLRVSDGMLNGAIRNVDTTFVMDIKRVPRPHYKLSLGQNPSFTRYYELMVTDPEEKAKNLEMYIYRDGTIPVGAVKMKPLSLFTWVGNFEFDTTANYHFEMKGDGLVGDTTVYDTATHALARSNRPWQALSYDGGFKVTSKSTNAVPFDKPFMIVDSLLFEVGEAEGGLYRMGHPLVEFEKPVMVTISSDKRFDANDQAIHQMTGGIWEELPTISKSGEIMAWTKSMGYFKIGDKTIEVPEETLLDNNYPNPFNSSTNIEFDIGFFGGPEQRVSISVYNILGQRVKTLHEGLLTIGRHSLRWNGRDKYESPVSSGIYVLRLISDTGVSQSKKMTLVR